jgi:hypothetical protein
MQVTNVMYSDIVRMLELFQRIGNPRRAAWLAACEQKKAELTGTLKCLCGKNMKWADMPVVNTGHMNVFDVVCRGCPAVARDIRDLSILVCVGCRKVMGRIPPHEKKSGFRYEAGKFYHINKCPECVPGIDHADCVEELVWLKHNKPKSIIIC